MNRAIFIDRDGVINRVIIKEGKPFSPRSVDEFVFCDGIESFLTESRRAGFLNIVFTNQPDIARGLVSSYTVEKIHDLIRRNLVVDGILICPHDDADNCRCRKPKPGMLTDAAEKWRINLNNSFVIGDQRKDIVAGREAGCVTILLDCPYNKGVEADYRVPDLRSALEIITQLKTGGVMDDYIKRYLAEAGQITHRIDSFAVEQLVEHLVSVRERSGRLFFLGVGGGAANATHAVNDFRKIAGIESYTPTDNVSELSARANDNGWCTVFADWLRTSKLCSNDAVFVLSVGGGDKEKNISANIVEALEYAVSVGATILGIVGRNGGFTARVADACVIVPTVSADTVTAHTEAFQAVIWHLVVSHPRIKAAEMKWESVR
jgi:D-sedoheptulose 7-phosphate isomerase